jgi:Glycosyltransferase family 87
MSDRLKLALQSRAGARALVEWIVAAQAVLLVVACVALWVRVFYFGQVDAVALITYHAADTPPVPAVPWQFGVHMFGDFLLPFEQALVPNPWVDYTQAANSYPPALMLLFKFLTFFPYRLALGVFLLLGAAGMVFPVAEAVRRFAPPRAIVCVCLLVILTEPFASVLDRANVQGLVLVPLYLFVVAWREQRWQHAARALAAAILLKLYPVILVLGLLAARRFRDAALAVGAAAAVTFVLLALYPHGLGATLHGFVAALAPFGSPNGVRFLVGNYSAAGMLANLSAVVFGPTSSELSWFFTHPSVCGFLYFVAVVAVVYARNLPFVVRAACALSMLALVSPLSYAYTLSFVFIVVAELLREGAFDDVGGSLPLPLAIALGTAVTLTLAPLPFPLPVTEVAVGTVLVPAAWIALTTTALVYAYGHRLTADAARRMGGVLLPPPAEES